MSILEKFKALIEDKKFDPSTTENREIFLTAAKALEEFEQVKAQSAEMLKQAQGTMLKMQADYWSLRGQHSQLQLPFASAQLEGIMELQEIRRLKAETEKQILELLREFEKKSEGAVTMALVHRNQVIGKEHGEIVSVNLEVKVL